MNVQRVRELFVLLIGVLTLLAFSGTATAGAATLDLQGFRLASPLLYVNENAGHATVAILRSDTSEEAQIRYITTGITAADPYDYTAQKGMLDFAVGQAVGYFQIPIIDHGVDGLSRTLKVSLFGPSPIGMGIPSTAVLTILYNDPVSATAGGNPLDILGLGSSTSSSSSSTSTTASSSAASSGTTSNPLAGAHFYVDPDTPSAQAAKTYPALTAISSQPWTARFGLFSYPDAATSVARYLARAQVIAPTEIPLLTTYRLVDRQCGNGDSPSAVAAYEKWIAQFADGVGTYRAVLFLEQDSLITAPCLNAHGLATRMAELNFAIDTLTKYCPHLVIYLDAGAADALHANVAAALLKRAGVAKIQGFFLNATHFDWTTHEIKYGQQISKMTGGKHFVVNTGESGQGPLIPKNRVKNGNEVLCNPTGRGLGPKATTNTGYRYVDAFAWLDNPGGSSGPCVPGAPQAGHYWPAYALMLVKNANYTVR